MGKYLPKFAKHEVDGLTLPDISEEELKAEVGVVEIGLRKRFRTQLCALDSAFCPAPRELRTSEPRPASAAQLSSCSTELSH